MTLLDRHFTSLLMLQLYAFAPEPASNEIWGQVGQRLRGASLVAGERLEDVGDCNAVLIDRYAPLQASNLETLLRADKHVLLVDSLPHTSDGLDTLASMAKNSDAQLQLVNSNRYLPSRQLIKQRIANHLGPPGLVRSYHWESDQPSPQVAGLPSSLFGDLDLMLWLFDEPVERVYAVEHHGGDSSAHTGRYLQLHIGFRQGMALLDYTNRLPAARPYQSLSVIGFSGAAYAEDDENMQLVFRDGQTQALQTRPQPVLARRALVQDFVDALACGRDLTSTNDCWQNVYALADTVNQSLASRQAIILEGC